MKVHKDWIGSKKTATKGDLADLQEDIHVDFQQFATKQDLTDAVEKLATKEDLTREAAKVNNILESILKVLDSIQGQLTDMKNHEVRIQRLEKKVFSLR